MKILITDDSVTIRKKMSHDLEAAEYECISASSGEDCLAKMSEDIKLIILDIQMSGMDGFQTLEKIYQNPSYSGIPAIFYTSYDNIEDRHRGFKVGAINFFHKDFDSGKLVVFVNSILRPEKQFLGVTALIVDDIKICRKVLIHELEHKGIEVISAENGQEALENFRKHNGNIDIIITDYEMPEMDGITFVQNIRKDPNGSRIPIFVVTADPSRDVVLKFYNAGVTDYIVKPFFKEELMARLSAHINCHLSQLDLRKKFKQLKEANEMNNRFLAICSHDLKAPLCSIQGFTELLVDEGGGLNQDALDLIKRIDNSTHHLLELINDLLDLRKEEQTLDYDKKSVDILEILDESITTMKGSAERKNISFDIKNENNWNILAEKQAMVRVFNNLFSNAIKFSQKEDTILIEMEKNEDMLLINVLDNGIGIPENKIDKIFSEFSGTSRKGTQGESGTGLGLSIVKTIIDKHNGSISVKSEPNQGTCFSFCIPLAESKK